MNKLVVLINVKFTSGSRTILGEFVLHSKFIVISHLNSISLVLGSQYQAKNYIGHMIKLESGQALEPRVTNR